MICDQDITARLSARVAELEHGSERRIVSDRQLLEAAIAEIRLLRARTMACQPLVAEPRIVPSVFRRELDVSLRLCFGDAGAAVLVPLGWQAHTQVPSARKWCRRWSRRLGARLLTTG